MTGDSGLAETADSLVWPAFHNFIGQNFSDTGHRH
jgi:hypothetical protein